MSRPRAPHKLLTRLRTVTLNTLNRCRSEMAKTSSSKAGSVAASSGVGKRKRAMKRKQKATAGSGFMGKQRRRAKAASKPKERAKAPRKRLSVKDVQLVCEELKDMDVEEMRGDVARQVESEYHMQFFEERMNLWLHIKSTNVMALDSLISTVLADFVKMYRQHSKGKDKYTRLLLAWYTYMNQYVVQSSDVGEAAWSKLVERYMVPAGGISECTRSCLLSSLMMGIFHEMLRRVECFVSELPGSTPSSIFPSATGYQDDDEASLYRLAGFALFSCVQFRQRKLMWRRKLQVNQETAQKLRTELALLKQLKDAQKSDLPAAIHIQDRGHMTFMNPILLPFIRNVAAEVRKLLNYQEYSKYGRDFFKVCLSGNL